MNLATYKKRTRREAIARLNKVAWYLDRIWQRKCPPASPNAPVGSIPKPDEFRRELMSMHVDDRELLLAAGQLHAIIDDLSLILPASEGGAA